MKYATIPPLNNTRYCIRIFTSGPRLQRPTCICNLWQMVRDTRYRFYLRLSGCVCLFGHSGDSWDMTDGYTSSHHETGYEMHSSCVHYCDPLACTHTLDNSCGIRWIIRGYKKKHSNLQQPLSTREGGRYEHVFKFCKLHFHFFSVSDTDVFNQFQSRSAEIVLNWIISVFCSVNVSHVRARSLTLEAMCD